MKEIKNLIKVKWVEYPHYHQEPDMEGYISEKAFESGRERSDRIKVDGSGAYAGYEIYYAEDSFSVSSTKKRYIECWEDERLNTGWGRADAMGGISSCGSPDGYMIEDDEKIYLIEW